MTGDLDMASNALLFADACLMPLGNYGLKVYNRAKTGYLDFQARNIFASVLFGLSWGGGLNPTSTHVAHPWYLRSGDGATNQICIEMKGAVANIPRSGDIEPALNNTYDCGGTNYWKEIRAINGKIQNLPMFANLATELQACQSALASATTGNMRYNPTTNVFEIYDGAAWQPH